MKSTLSFDADHPLLKGHVLHGRHVLPGLAYIDLIYRLFRAEGHDFQRRELQQLTIYRPLDVAAGERLDVVVSGTPVEGHTPPRWAVRIEGAAAGSAPQLFATACMQSVDPVVLGQRLDEAAFAAQATQTLALDAAYAGCRARELVHDGILRAEGSALLSPEGLLVKIAIGAPARANAERTMFHPALLDGSAIALLGSHADREPGAASLGLSVPLHIQSFRASALLQRDCRTLIPAASRRRQGDVSTVSMAFFDEQGRQVAELRDCAAKLIRHAGLIDPTRAPVDDAARDLPDEPPLQSAAAAEALAERAQAWLQKLVGRRLSRTAATVSTTLGYYEMGLASADLMHLVGEINGTTGLALAPTLMFEYPTIRELAQYLCATYASALSALGTVRPAAAEAAPVQRTSAAVRALPASPPAAPVAAAREDIAIVGLAGRYPQARDLAMFWQNLARGVDSVSDLPVERWPGAPQFALAGAPKRRGGFIDGIDEFDPLFFNLPPRAAEYMDPQERLFLQCAYEAIEDAGYTRDNLAGSGESGVGVFVGVMYQEYQLYGAQEQARGQPAVVSGSAAAIANRVSFFGNFHGPSLAIDTMCSSSLTAVHLACQNLQRGACDVAIAGGVNVSAHPNKYLMLTQNKFLSSKGRCESFGEGGDGYVPGEGVGAVVLKPLSRAEADGDHIYGVIRASAVNHGGRASGFTVPNPKAQGAVIERALRDAGVDARAVSYIEAHGTGTSLGDPVEIAGLARAFGRSTGDRQFCAIGSAKSNIGHCESAAGVAGITKVLLQMQHGQIAPSLHAATLNPHIDFESSPFVVQQALGAWVRPTVHVAGQAKELPRLAGVSSFGAGGSNAHVLIEEYTDTRAARSARPVSEQQPALVVLSARSAGQLKDQARRLLDAVSAGAPSLEQVAYTLQVGREAFEERLALSATTVAELCGKLQAWLDGRTDVDELFCGQVARDADRLALFAADDDLARAIDAWVAKGKHAKLLDLWAKGLDFDWRKLYPRGTPQRLSLPTYPFARERYWITVSGEAAGARAASLRHPLLQENTSDLNEQRYSTHFSGQEFFLRDHVIGGQLLLPGVVSLEMARAAAQAALGGGSQSLELRDVVWARPLAVTQAQQVHIALRPEGDEVLGFEVYADGTGDAPPTVYSHGRVLPQRVAAPAPRDLEAWQLACSEAEVGAEAYYARLQGIGLNHGASLRSIERVGSGQGQAMARLRLPADLVPGQAAFGLHPSLLDGALQAAASLVLGARSGAGARALPYALERVRCHAPCPANAWALVQARDDGGLEGGLCSLDVDLCDDAGRVCVELHGFSLRRTESPAVATPVVTPNGPCETLLLQRRWTAQPAQMRTPAPGQHVALLCLPDAAAQGIAPRALADALPGLRCVDLAPMQGETLDVAYERCAQALLAELQRALAARPAQAVVLQVLVPSVGDAQPLAGLVGLLRTARQENPKLMCQLIELDAPGDVAVLARLLSDEARDGSVHVRHGPGERLVATWEEVTPDPTGSATPPWRADGVYLITGGAGGLGLVFAHDIARTAPGATVVLTGRSAPDADKLAACEALARRGVQALYRPVDVTDPHAVAGLIDGIVAQHGRLDGILHSAGVKRDSFLIKKTAAELHEVFAPKVAGLVNLDLASRDLALSCFLCFSSTAGALGNVGQADYAAANAFMDAYMHHRNSRVAMQQRQGRSLSVNWPLWAEGGMQVDAPAEQLMRQRSGMATLGSADGLRAAGQAWASGEGQVLVVHGVRAQLAARLGLPMAGAAPAATESAPPARRVAAPRAPREDFNEQALGYFTRLLASAIKLSAERIDAHAPLERYGIDSVMVMRLTTQLETVFGPLSKTLFFEHQSIAALTAHFVLEHRTALEAALGHAATDGAEVPTPAPASVVPAAGLPSFAAQRERCRPRFASETGTAARPPAADDRIAIVGLSGRYPEAEDVEAFWQRLAAGVDCIREVPADRWDHRQFYDAVKGTPGKTHSKWGGFLDSVADFDPAFFSIPQREAEVMDPQERLFLQEAFAAIEDAGYTAGTLEPKRQVGVFVGVMYLEYQFYGVEAQQRGLSLALHSSPSAIANRVSYHANFNGPSLAVDTMCSSSLTALHLACQSLRDGSCRVAIAGGVNVSVHPNKYLMLGRNGFVSSKGRCETFGEGGDGYVPGEGVGAVVLKPLAQAIADGDHIHGVIRATALNHGGKTNGFAVPNPVAQGEVIAEAIARAGVDARAISYVEAHGTGTSLGDPIEIAGLAKAFGRSTQDLQFCAIGSAKSNIGHCESAAGIAGLTKVLMQMRHGQIAPSLHSKRLNPLIDFAATPFVVQQSLGRWERPSLEVNGTRREMPRLAGVSSFGAGGANAHVLVEEYRPALAPRPVRPVSAQQPALILLSARQPGQLVAQGERLLRGLQGPLRDVLLEDLAYTLQVGREAHEERLAFAVATHQDLCDKLGAWLAGATDVEELYQGRAGAHNDGLALFAIDEELHEAVDKWLQRGKHRRLLALWAKGVQIDWRKLYADGTPQRVSLPTYPYARQRCWLPQAAGAPVDVATGLRAAAPVAETPGARGAGPGAAPDPYAGLPTLETLLAATGPTASRCVMQGLAKLIARVRKLDPAVMADEDTYADQPISSFGIDSVGAMEVRSAIRPWLGVDVPSHLLIGAHPMREVAATLHDKLLLQHLSGAATGAVTDVTALDEEVLVL